MQDSKRNTGAFYNESNYDRHFIIRQVMEEFKGHLECLAENTEIYTTFLLLIEKEENGKNIKYKIRFINSISFLTCCNMLWKGV